MNMGNTFSADDRVSLGEALVGRRRELGLTQRQLEKECRIPQGKISRIERGIARATVDELGSLAAPLRLRVNITIDLD